MENKHMDTLRHDLTWRLCKAYVREYLHKIWPYMVQYLHFRIQKFPLIKTWSDMTYLSRSIYPTIHPSLFFYLSICSISSNLFKSNLVLCSYLSFEHTCVSTSICASNLYNLSYIYTQRPIIWLHLCAFMTFMCMHYSSFHTSAQCIPDTSNNVHCMWIPLQQWHFQVQDT
jgi:hypothetical protein